MGIPVYFSHIIQNYNHILKKIQEKQYFDLFFLDANSIVYDAYYNLLKQEINVKNDELENMIIEKTIEKINDVIKLFTIEKEVVVCFDGVAPISKLKQQRERRFKTWIRNEVCNKNDKNSWNTCSITPGTKFMKKLNYKLDNYKNNFYKINPSRKEKIIILNSEYEGEGEQKIFSYLRNNYPNKNNLSISIPKINLNICVYGLDSDLIMLSLLYSNFYEKIYLYRETPEFIKNLNNKLNPNEKYLLNIPNLSHQLTRNVYSNNNIHFSKNVNSLVFRSNMNYVILFFLLGNDFMPHHPGLSLRLNGAEELIRIYNLLLQDRDLFYILNNKIYIDWTSLKIVMKELSINEIDNIKDYHNYKNNIKRKIFSNKKIMCNSEEILNFIPVLQNEEEEFVLSNDKYIKERYYETSFSIEYNIKNICYHYLKNIEWNLFYYLGQEECNYYYYYPYHHAPLFQDCLHFIPLKFETLYDKNITSKSYIHYITQLLYILPSTYYELIDKQELQLYSLLENPNSKILFNNPSELISKIDNNFVKYFFESVIHFHYVNIFTLQKQVLNIIKI
tara:strand:+ start:2540 stop:4222 length:1683 start_codon:yes stop_codon:yes gene_type:complete